MKSAAVSVLIPIYNVEKYLEECLESVCDQTLKDIEIICINDGSTDSSLKIIKDFQKNDDRIVLIDKKNSGYGDSMNKGLEKATGEYIGIVESDDFIEKDAFEKLYNLAKKNKAEIVRSNYFYYKASENSIHRSIKNQELETAMSILDDTAILYEEPAIWSAIYKKSFLDENEIRFLPTPGASYQDTGFNFKALSSARRIVYTNKPYLHYRTDNANSSVKSLAKVTCVMNEFAEIEKYLDENDAPVELKYIEQVAKFGAYHWNLQRLPKDLALEFLKLIKAEYAKAKKLGLLKKSYFPIKHWVALWIILRFPPKRAFHMLSTRMHIKSAIKHL